MNIDIDRLKADVRQIEAALMDLRPQMRVEKPGRARYERLFELKARATLLYAIRAHARGRLHLRKVTRSHGHLGLPQKEVFTLDDQERWIGERWLDYQRTVIDGTEAA